MPIALPNSGENVTRMPDHVPDGHADQDAGDVAGGALARREQLQEAAARVRQRLHLLEHPRLVHADAQHQQRDPHRAADEVRRAPVEPVADEDGHHGAADADRGDERRRVAAALARHDLADERDARAQLARQADAGDQAQRRVLRDRRHVGVRKLAIEYITIDPNSTDSRPRRSPRMPHAMPPTSIPVICMFSSSTPCDKQLVGGTPIAVRLRTRTMLNRIRS